MRRQLTHANCAQFMAMNFAIVASSHICNMRCQLMNFAERNEQKMDYISGWARGLITIVIMSSFIELILPRGDIKKYVRFASGLIIIVLIVKPLFNIKNIEIPKLEPLQQEEYVAVSIHDIYVEKLEKNVEKALGIANVKITVNPENLAEVIYVSSKTKKEEIASYLGLPLDRVGD